MKLRAADRSEYYKIFSSFFWAFKGLLNITRAARHWNIRVVGIFFFISQISINN